MYISRLKDLREDSDMSQEQIAQLLNCSQQAYSNYENGKRSLPYELLIKLAEIHKTTPNYILGITNEK